MVDLYRAASPTRYFVSSERVSICSSGWARLRESKATARIPRGYRDGDAFLCALALPTYRGGLEILAPGREINSGSEDPGADGSTPNWSSSRRKISDRRSRYGNGGLSPIGRQCAVARRVNASHWKHS